MFTISFEFCPDLKNKYIKHLAFGKKIIAAIDVVKCEMSSCDMRLRFGRCTFNIENQTSVSLFILIH